ncbi:MAG: hypothetical protein ACI8WT_004872 [Clostridium sp.]|jgi:hypothetical protein
MNKVSCEVIKDMLPLYYDEVCSGETKKMVEDHLNQCSNCKSELERIRADIIIPKETVEKNRSDGNAIKNIANLFNRSKIKAFAIGIICATALFMMYVGLFKWNIISVPTDVAEITNICELANAEIAYHVKLTDGYNLNECRYDMKEDGNTYLTPLRPIIKSKSIVNMGLQNSYYTFGFVERSAYEEKYGDGAEIKALYYGTPKDNILIWKKGMDVPRASEEVQAEFNFEN